MVFDFEIVALHSLYINQDKKLPTSDRMQVLSLKKAFIELRKFRFSAVFIAVHAQDILSTVPLHN